MTLKSDEENIKMQSMYQETCAHNLYIHTCMNKDNGTKNGRWGLGYVIYA